MEEVEEMLLLDGVQEEVPWVSSLQVDKSPKQKHVSEGDKTCFGRSEPSLMDMLSQTIVVRIFVHYTACLYSTALGPTGMSRTL